MAGKFLTNRLVQVYAHQSHLDPDLWENHWPPTLDDFRKEELEEQLRGHWTLRELMSNTNTFKLRESKKRKEFEDDEENPFS